MYGTPCFLAKLPNFKWSTDDNMRREDIVARLEDLTASSRENCRHRLCGDEYLAAAGDAWPFLQQQEEARVTTAFDRSWRILLRSCPPTVPQ